MNDDSSIGSSTHAIDGFSIYCSKNKDLLVSRYPTLSAIEINQKLSEEWNNLGENQKQQYKETAMLHNKNDHSYGFGATVHEGNLLESVDYPTDPTAYLTWLGQQVLQFHVQNTHLNIDTKNVQFSANPDADVRSYIEKFITYNQNKA